MSVPASIFQNLETGIAVEETTISGGFTGLFGKLKQSFAKHRERSRLRAQLMSLDDRMLKDIGLHRSDLPMVVDGHIPENRLGLQANENAGAPNVSGKTLGAA